MASLGERIVALRSALGWSQTELAKRVGISQPSMHNIETGATKTLRGATLAGLCRTLNVSPDVLLGNKRSLSQEAVLHEAEILALWRALGDAEQEHLLATARAFARKPVPDNTTPAAKPHGKTGKPSRREGDSPATTGHGKLTAR